MFKKTVAVLGITAAILLIANIAISNADSQTAGATVTTDKRLYHQGETMVITGAGFKPSVAIAVTVTRPDKIVEPLTDVRTVGDGTFVAYYVAPGINGSYRITASDGVNTADTRAADPTLGKVADYSQCANDQGLGFPAGSKDPGCYWTNGDLNGNNSTYIEGDSTVQRLLLAELPAGSHTVYFKYETTKSGKHAYDFLTDDDYSEYWITPAELCQDADQLGFAQCAGAPVSSLSIPQDPNAGGIDVNAANSGRRHFRMRNGVITQISVPTIVSGTYSGDSDTLIGVTFTVDPATCLNAETIQGVPTCPVLITFGAHVSRKADWATIDGRGTASTISGSPYHVMLGDLDSQSTGSKDNQMQANAIAAGLTLVKNVVNDNGGTATPSAWTLTATGPVTITGPGNSNLVTQVAVKPGTYALSESGGPTGYTAGQWSCSINGLTPAFGSSVTLTSGDSATCTITNDDNAPVLHLVKQVNNENGGTATPANWTLTANGGTLGTLSGPGPYVDSGATFKAGTYALSESGGPATGYQASAWVCAGGTQNGANITLALGETATCTITNDDVPPSLTLVKTVTNDNGGTATPAQFTLTANGAGAGSLSGAGPSVSSGSSFKAGTYALSESGPSGYLASDWSCVKNGAAPVTAASITLALADVATCTINNNDIPPQLHLRKVVVNDNGGAAVATDWTLYATGARAQPTNLSGTTPVDSDATLMADTYTLSESTGPFGYSASWNCTGATAVGTGAVATVVVPPGANVTCTVTNDDIPGHLVVIKHVVNDNGGTATAANFTMNVAGVSPSPASFPGAEAPGVTVNLNTGSYEVTENGPSGYLASYSPDCTGSISIGQTKTCTVTNDDIQPKLIVIKNVINDNGGTAVSGDFAMSVTGSSPTPASFPGAVAPGTTVALNAGSYSVGENGPSGYAANYSAACSGTIAIGETKTCTVTNDDIQPTLIVIKHVVNDNGGTAAAANFTMDVAGNSVSLPSFPGAEAPGTTVRLNAGAYGVTENGPAGYAATYGTACTGSIAIGETRTCTVTNDDIQPKLIVIKHVVNDNNGPAVAANFTMNVAGTAVSPSAFPGAETPGTTVGLNAGTYAVTETVLSGYTPAYSADCTGSIGIGQTKTCTVVNDDQPGRIIINKITKGQEGATFTFPVTGITPDPYITIPGANQSGSVSLYVNRGNYSITENPLSGWTLTDAACDSGAVGTDTNGDGILDLWSFTVLNGGTVTCTFTNNGQHVTRTQGFWATHTGLANAVWNGGAGMPADATPVVGSADQFLCQATPITAVAADGQNQLLGGFWTNVAKTSENKKRNDLDQARMQMLQQYLAAVLNFHAFGAGSEAMLSGARAAYCGNSAKAVQDQIGILGTFNSSGDNLAFTPGASATAQLSKSQADIDFWDTTNR